MAHWNKNEKQSNSNRLSGSNQFRAAVRSMITVFVDKDDQRIWYHDKPAGVAKQPALGFVIEEPDGMVLWGKANNIPEDNESKVYQAEKWIKEYLVKFDSIPVQEAKKIAPFNAKTLDRARHNLRGSLCTVWNDLEGSPAKVACWEIQSEKNIFGKGKLKTGSPSYD